MKTCVLALAIASFTPSIEAAIDGLRGPMLSFMNRRELTEGTGKCLDDNGFKLSMMNSSIAVNNLKGMGPDFGNPEKVLRYNNIGELDGRILALELTIKDGWNYVMDANRANENGYVCTAFGSCDTVQGSFARVSQRPGHETTVIFTILDQETLKPVTVPVVKFSVYDIDQDGNSRKEGFVVSGWKTALYDVTQAEAFFTEDADGFCDQAKAAGENCLYSLAKFDGNGCDTPMSPTDLGIVNCGGRIVNQLLRMFQVDFENVSTWEMYMSAGTSDKAGSRGTLFALDPTTRDLECTDRLQPEARSTELDDEDSECPEDL